MLGDLCHQEVVVLKKQTQCDSIVSLHLYMFSKFSLASYNTQGSGTGHIEYVQKLINTCDFVLIQEHWLGNNQFPYYERYIPGINTHCISAMDDSMVSCGRPFGGCAIIWRQSLDASVTPIVTVCKRVCAVKIQIGGHKILLFNVYMPFYNNTDSLSEYNEVLGVISSISLTEEYDDLLIGGDFNTNVNRHDPLSNLFSSFVNVNGLYCGLNAPVNLVDHTFESKSLESVTSIIDHFIMSQGLFSSLNEYTSVHDGDNMSDHCPIVASFSIDVKHWQVSETCTAQSKAKLDWDKATSECITQYQCFMHETLSQLQFPNDFLACNDFFCKNPSHVYYINQLHTEIINATLDAGNKVIPKCKKTWEKSVIGWNEFVSHNRQDAIFWHKLWKDSGKPSTGFLKDMRNNSRYAYHYALKYVRNNKEVIQSEKLAQYLISNSNKNFWNSIKRTKQHHLNLPNNIDGVTGSAEISDVFADKYYKLYNSVSYDNNEMFSVLHDINDRLSRSCCTDTCYSTHNIDVCEVEAAVKSLKSGKSDGIYDQKSNHIINGPKILFVWLSLLFNVMLKHGIVPSSFLVSTVIPIPKCKNKSLNSSDNCRGIALSSLIGKLFDIVVFKANSNILITSDYQFGFKKGHSTQMCSFAVN